MLLALYPSLFNQRSSIMADVIFIGLILVGFISLFGLVKVFEWL